MLPTRSGADGSTLPLLTSAERTSACPKMAATCSCRGGFNEDVREDEARTGVRLRESHILALAPAARSRCTPYEINVRGGGEEEK